MQEKPNVPTGTFYQVYLPAFAPKGFADLNTRIQYFRWLGISALVRQPDNEYLRDSLDGPYSPFDHMAVDPGLGGESALVDVNASLERVGITPVGDLVANHADERSELVRRALRDPERWRSWLRVTDNLERDKWGYKTNVFDLPPYHECEELGAGMHRSTAFYPDQWELNVENPDVIEYICDVAERMIERWRCGGLRLDACGNITGSIGRPPVTIAGPAVRNVADPAALLLAEAIRRRIRRLRGSTGHQPFTIAEAGGMQADIAAWLEPCDLGYDFEWLPTLLQCLDTADWAPLRQLRREQPETAGMFLRYLGSHDQRDFRYSPYKDDLIRRHGGPDGKFVCYGGTGVTRRVRDLLPSEDAMVMLLGLTIFSDGVPLIFQGDAEGYGGDASAHERDPRDPNRCLMPWDSRLKNAGWPDDAPYPLEPTWRQRSVYDQFRDATSPLNRVRQFIRVRNRFDALQWGDEVEVKGATRRVEAFARTTPGPDGQVVIVIANSSTFPQTVYADLSPWRGRLLRQLNTNPRTWAPGVQPEEQWVDGYSWADAHEYRADLGPHELMVIEAY